MNTIAPKKARELAHAQIEPAHLLWAMLHDGSGLSDTLSSAGIDLLYARDWAETHMEEAAKAKGAPSEPEPSMAADDVMREARRLVARFPAEGPHSENAALLAVLCRPGLAFTKDQLQTFPISESMVVELFGQPIKEEKRNRAVSRKPSNAEGVLDVYCIDRTAQARDGVMDPVIGRDKELRQMLEILGRRSTPNVVLLGEPGVGKTALVEGFALSIVQGLVPERLKGACVFELDLGALVAGASYKGETEDRMKKILRALQGVPGAVLFIDEVHALLDPQGSVGKGLADILKPELARGGLTVIAATTNEEYRKYMEKDEAFARRFGIVRIEEPDISLAEHMLEAIAPAYARHHRLQIDQEAIAATVSMAKRYVKDRALPTSAVALMDQTMAAVRLMQDTALENVERLKSEWEGLLQNMQHTGSEFLKDLDLFELRMRRTLSPLFLAALDDSEGNSYKEVAREERITSELGKLQELASKVRENVLASDVASIVSHNTGIPIGKLQSGERDRLLGMATMLGKRVMGQDHVLKAVTESLIDARGPMARDGKPKGAFFFLGPTGTGKTELTKAIAEQLFNDEDALIRFDMSEYKEERDVQKLIGTSPGLVGYEEGGLLVNRIRRQPYSVVLFDEIEKAHPKIFDLFLQILGEGFVTDNKGTRGDFSNALIIFTSNIGAAPIMEIFRGGRVPSTDELSSILARSEGFRPELIGRFVAYVDIIPFAPITREVAGAIFDHHLRKEVLDGLSRQGVELHLHEEARDRLISEGYNEDYGARPLLGIIRNRVRKPVSRYLIELGDQIGGVLSIAWDKDHEDITIRSGSAD